LAYRGKELAEEELLYEDVELEDDDKELTLSRLLITLLE